MAGELIKKIFGWAVLVSAVALISIDFWGFRLPLADGYIFLAFLVAFWLFCISGATWLTITLLEWVRKKRLA